LRSYLSKSLDTIAVLVERTPMCYPNGYSQALNVAQVSAFGRLAATGMACASQSTMSGRSLVRRQPCSFKTTEAPSRESVFSCFPRCNLSWCKQAGIRSCNIHGQLWDEPSESARELLDRMPSPKLNTILRHCAPTYLSLVNR
jgi:hypothetical protein